MNGWYFYKITEAQRGYSCILRIFRRQDSQPRFPVSIYFGRSAHDLCEHLCNKAGVMVNFICQLDWAMNPDIYSNIILDVSVKASFLGMRLTFKSIDFK